MPRDFLDYLNIPAQWPYAKGKGVKVAVLDEPAGDKYAIPVNYANQVHYHGQGVAYIIHTIAPEAEIFGVDVLGRWPLDEALDWCIKNGVDIVNMSLMYAASGETADALKRAAEAGIILVAAAGNYSSMSFPGYDPHVIPVEAYYPITGGIFGGDGPEAWITAPSGAEVPSPAGGWVPLDQTSGATPHITGCLALYIARFREVNGRKPTPDECRAFLRTNARDIGPPGKDNAAGYGVFKFPAPETWPEVIQVPTPDYIGAKWIGSPNRTSGRGGKAPFAVVMHIMAGTLAGTDSWFQNPTANASAHYGVGKNGEVHQYVEERDSAWHAGIVNKPSWLFYDGTNPNAYTIGIECEGQPGDPWHDAQYYALLALTKDICRRRAIPVDEDHIIGHYRIDAVRRPNDPGPTFPWQRLFADLRGEPPSPQPAGGEGQKDGAAPGVAKVIEIWIGRNTAKVNGQEVKIDQPAEVDTDTNRTVVPLRFVAEALGASVEWDGKDKKITITKEG